MISALAAHTSQPSRCYHTHALRSHHQHVDIAQENSGFQIAAAPFVQPLAVASPPGTEDSISSEEALHGLTPALKKKVILWRDASAKKSAKKQEMRDVQTVKELFARQEAQLVQDKEELKERIGLSEMSIKQHVSDGNDGVVKRVNTHTSAKFADDCVSRAKVRRIPLKAFHCRKAMLYRPKCSMWFIC